MYSKPSNACEDVDKRDMDYDEESVLENIADRYYQGKVHMQEECAAQGT